MEKVKIGRSDKETEATLGKSPQSYDHPVNAIVFSTIGRTGLIAGCILSRLGMPFADIFTTLSAARGVPMPDTQGQIDWVQVFNGGASNAYSAKI